jgi:hypothetical protein
MTGHTSLYSTEPPWFHVVTTEARTVTNALWAITIEAPDSLRGELVLRFLRGAKMRTYNSYFDEISAAMQFPYYFGSNLNALNDCLRDLDWLPGKAYILAVLDASELLIDEDEDAAPDLLRLLHTSVAEWNTGTQITDSLFRPPTPFHILLHAPLGEDLRLRKVLSQAHLEYSDISFYHARSLSS